MTYNEQALCDTHYQRKQLKVTTIYSPIPYTTQSLLKQHTIVYVNLFSCIIKKVCVTKSQY